MFSPSSGGVRSWQESDQVWRLSFGGWRKPTPASCCEWTNRWGRVRRWGLAAWPARRQSPMQTCRRGMSGWQQAAQTTRRSSATTPCCLTTGWLQKPWHRMCDPPKKASLSMSVALPSTFPRRSMILDQSYSHIHTYISLFSHWRSAI